MKIFGKTDTGRVRKSNQDCYAAGELDDGMVWAVVCDGMGGHAGGNIASSAAVKVISDMITSKYKKNMSRRSIKNLLMAAVSSANLNVFDISKSNSDLEGMGTTVVAAIIAGGNAYIVHVGDSRAYLITENDITQLTSDHSLVQQMVDYGKLTPTEAKTHPNRNIITKAVGIEKEVTADYTETELLKGSKLLICTDGLTNCVDDEEILSIVSDSGDNKFIDKLVERALANGGEDNITAVIITD